MKILNLIEGITDDNKKGSMVAIMIPPSVGVFVQKKYESVPGDAVDVRDMHITLLLVREPDKKKEIAEAIKAVSVGSFPISIDGFDVFPPNEHNENKYVLHAKINLDEKMKDLHSRLKRCFEQRGISADNGNFDFKPHATIKYCDEMPDIKQDFKHAFLCNKVHYATNGEYYGRKI